MISVNPIDAQTQQLQVLHGTIFRLGNHENCSKNLYLTTLRPVCTKEGKNYYSPILNDAQLQILSDIFLERAQGVKLAAASPFLSIIFGIVPFAIYKESGVGAAFVVSSIVALCLATAIVIRPFLRYERLIKSFIEEYCKTCAKIQVPDELRAKANKEIFQSFLRLSLPSVSDELQSIIDDDSCINVSDVAEIHEYMESTRKKNKAAAAEAVKATSS